MSKPIVSIHKEYQIASPMLNDLVKKKIVSFARARGYIIIARCHVNKTRLNKILREWLGRTRK